jgi:hypothetical protein
MTLIKSSLIGFVLGCIIMLGLAYKFMPRPEPIIRIVEVESKKTAKKKVTSILPDGTTKITEDEITDYLRNYGKEQNPTPERTHHAVDGYFNRQTLKGLSYKYKWTKNFNTGVLYKDELLGSVGWEW